MYVHNSTGVVERSIYINNVGQNAAGAEIEGHSIITFKNINFTGNVADFNGGAFVANLNSSATMESCRISNNSATMDGNTHFYVYYAVCFCINY